MAILGKFKRPFFSTSFLLLALSSVLFYSSMYIFLNYLPDYVLSLGGTQASVGLVTGAFVLCSLAIRPFVGWIIDHWGRKQVLMLGTGIFSGAPLLYGLVHSVNGLIAVRMIHGLGLSLFTTAALTLVTDLVENARWGEATGFFLSAQVVAISLAPGIGSLIARARNLPALIPYATALGILSLIASCLVRSHAPIRTRQHLNVKINYPGVIAASVAAITVGLGYSTVITFLPVIAKQNGLQGASLFYFLYAATALLVRTPAGRFSDRAGRRWLIFPTVALSSIALFMVSRVVSPFGIGLSALLYGLGFGSAYPIIGAMAADHSPVEMRGVAVGYYQAGFDTGLLLGSVLGGKIGFLYGVNNIFLFISALIFAGLALFYVLSAQPRKLSEIT